MMNYLKFIFRTALVLALSFSFLSCSDDDDDKGNNGIVLEIDKGVYILNSGAWGENDAVLSFYNKEKKEITPDIFETQNKNLHLGDLGQDIIIKDNKMYIAMTGSAIIYVTDLQGRLLKKIESYNGSQLQEPRGLAAYGNYVYVTFYDGYLARINTNTLALDETQVKVGRSPEYVKVANGKLYVANSGGSDFPNYDNTVSVVDINTFTELKKIEVEINPTKVAVDKYENVYVISNGDYFGEPVIPSLVQRIDSKGDTIHSTLGEASYIKPSADGQQMYIINSIWNSPTAECKIYDVKTEAFLNRSFVNSDVTFSAAPSSIDIEPSTGNIYIGVSAYTSEGEMYIISPNGTLIHNFKTGGVNPMGAYFLN